MNSVIKYQWIFVPPMSLHPPTSTCSLAAPPMSNMGLTPPSTPSIARLEPLLPAVGCCCSILVLYGHSLLTSYFDFHSSVLSSTFTLLAVSCRSRSKECAILSIVVVSAGVSRSSFRRVSVCMYKCMCLCV